jgi:6-pyruvoyltetrahydropterin/6-carboxytetrahydropterin synthase
MFKLTVTTTFDAAHFLPNYAGKCAQMHGHTWKIEATWHLPGSSINNPNGIAVDFGILKKMLNTCAELFDHKMINQVLPIPSAEYIAVRIFEMLREMSQAKGIPGLTATTVYENVDAVVVYTPYENDTERE